MSNNHDLDLSYEYDESAVNEIVDEAPGSNNFMKTTVIIEIELKKTELFMLIL